jgi:hypothetical protein
MPLADLLSSTGFANGHLRLPRTPFVVVKSRSYKDGRRAFSATKQGFDRTPKLDPFTVVVASCRDWSSPATTTSYSRGCIFPASRRYSTTSTGFTDASNLGQFSGSSGRISSRTFCSSGVKPPSTRLASLWYYNTSVRRASKNIMQKYV